MISFSRKNSGIKRSKSHEVRFEPLENRQMLSATPTLYADDTQGRLFTVNVGTGAVHVIGKMPTVMYDIAFDSHGNLYGVDGASGTSSLWKINPTNATASRIGGVGAEVNSLVFSAGGTLYAAGSSLYKLNTATGAGTKIGTGLSGFTSAGDLAFDASGKLFLSTNQNNDLVRVNTSTGSATVIGPIGYSQVYGLAYANGTLYGLSNTTSQIFSVGTVTGHGYYMSSFAGKGVSGVNGSAFLPAGVTLPTAPTIYAADSSGTLYTVNAGSGQTHVIGHMSTVMYDIAFNASGKLYGIDSKNGLYQINSATAAISEIGVIGVNDNINSLTFSSNGYAYAAGHDLYKIDLTNGVFWDIGSLGGYSSAGDLAFNKYGQLVMSTTTNKLIEINTSTAGVSLLGNIGFSSVLGLAEASNGVLYGMSNTTDQIFSVDPVTGLGTNPVSFYGVNGVYGASVNPV